MSTIVEATVPADQFALHETFQELPETSFEMVRAVASGQENVNPFVWASGADQKDLQTALEADPSTSSVKLLVGSAGEFLFELEWALSASVAFDTLVGQNAYLLDAVASDDEWEFRLVFPERDAVSETFDTCQAYGLDLVMERIGEFTGSTRRGQFGLTEKQSASMLDAFEAGYYDVPRRIKQEELADRLGLSHQALSERLRRGHKTLVANALNPDGDRSALPTEVLINMADDGPSPAIPSGLD